jgi:hypothetical protein
MSGCPWVREAIVGEVGTTRAVVVEPVGEGGANRWVRWVHSGIVAQSGNKGQRAEMACCLGLDDGGYLTKRWVPCDGS